MIQQHFIENDPKSAEIGSFLYKTGVNLPKIPQNSFEFLVSFSLP